MIAGQRMTETAVFFTESKVDNPITLQPELVETIVASGVPARVKVSGQSARDVEIAGQAPVVSPLEVHVPIGSVDVGPSVFVRITASTSDSGLVGSRYRTKDFPTKGQATAWRYPVEQVS